ncbi:MAG: TonB-dependent receptor [Desulfarculaceae bacterium]
MSQSLSGAAPSSPKLNDDGDTVEITAEQIKRLNAHSLVSLLNLVPGVKASTGHVSIRGSYKVRVLLDGMSLKDPSSGTLKLELVPFKQIQRVVIKKGGGSVAYGDDSSGGVILIFTGKAKKTVTHLETSAGNYGYQNYKANLSHAMGRLGLSLSAEYLFTERYLTNFDKLARRAGVRLSYTPEFWKGDCPPTLAVDLGQVKKGNPGYPAYPTPHSRSHDDSLGVSFTWANWGFRSGTYYTRFRNDSLNPDAGFTSELKSRTFKQDLRKSFNLNQLGTLSCGVLAAYARGEGNNFDPRNEQSYGIFASDSLEIPDLNLTLQLGLRANLYSEFDTALNPEVKLSLNLGWAKLKASANKTNNVPTFRQRYFRTGTLIPNPGLDSEEGTNYSLGIWLKGPWNLEADVTWFWNQIKDRITYVRGDGGIGQYRNLGKTSIRGLETAISLKPAKWLEFRPSYTYLEAKDEETDLWLTSKPRHKIKADLILRPWPQFMLGCHYTYSSEVFTRSDNTEKADSYHTVDIRAEYNISGWRIFGKIDNIFDEKYIYGDGYPAPPLTWIMGVSYEF